MEKSERKIFELIKKLEVSELSFILNEDSNSAPLIYKFVNNIEDNINPIKESKLIMGTKKYLYGIAKLTNEEIEYFNPNPNSDVNKNN